MIQSKPAQSDYPIHPLISNRWSPVSFSDQSVEKEKINSLIEAARWAPSSYNEQPWQYIVGIKGDETHKKLSACLNEGNHWAIEAQVLMCSVGKAFFDHGHKPNRHYLHDLGMATMSLVLQATDMNLITHQMAGFDLDKLRDSFSLDEGFEPGSIIAIGYPGEPLEDSQKERDSMPRQRKSHQDLIWK